MPDLEDGDFELTIVDVINDPVAALSNTVSVRIARQFFAALCSRVLGKRIYSLDDALTLSLSS